MRSRFGLAPALLAALKLSFVGWVAVAAAPVSLAQSTQPATQPAASVAILHREIEYLSSDDLAGRAVGSPGIQAAANHLVDRFRQAGLQPPPGQDNYVQEFQVFRSSPRPTTRPAATRASATPPATTRSTATTRLGIGAMNIVGYWPGQGPSAAEFIVIGAHYDHLGRSADGEIYHGADDNASGTAALLELVRLFTSAGPQRRSLLFVAFSAEELGLLGSDYFVLHCPVPRQQIVTMVNLDMVGRLRLNMLTVSGMGTASEFPSAVQRAAAAAGVMVLPTPGASVAVSDHFPFSRVGIPVLFICTGPHFDEHKPTDVASRINYEGEARVVNFAHDLILDLATMPRPTPVPTTLPATSPAEGVGEGAAPPN